MKKILGLLALSATIMCCNTPQPATGTGTTADSAGTGSSMNSGTNSSTTTPSDTTRMPGDSLQLRTPL